MSLYCDTVLPTYQEDICENTQGRIIAVAFIRSDATITDYTNINQWQTAIANGQVKIIKNVKGSKPKSTPNEIEGFGRETSRTTGREFTMNYMHPDVLNNYDFYNTLNYDSSHRVAYWISEKKLFVVEDAFANVNADDVIEEGLDSIVSWDVEVKWKSKNMALPYASPEALFEV